MVSDGNPLKKVLDWTSGVRELETSYTYTSLAFEIKAKNLNDVILGPITDEELVVMRIYYPGIFQYLYSDSIEDSQKRAHEHYLKERRAIDQLKAVQEFNNIYLEQRDVEVEFTYQSGGTITGNAIISKFIESDPIPQTLETYELAKRQLEIIHEAGIIHGRINEYNIVFAAGKVYLYNLSHSQFIENNDPERRDQMIKADFRDLRSCFHRFP